MTTIALKTPAAATNAPPHNAEVERAILSVVLDGRTPDAWGRVKECCAGVPAFYVREHRLVALVIDELHTEGIAPDAQVVADRAQRIRYGDAMDTLAALDGEKRPKPRDGDVSYEDSLLAGIGGFNAVASLSESLGSVSGLERNAEIMDDHYRRRLALTALDGARDRLARGKDDASTVADDLTGKLGVVFGRGRVADTLGDCADRVLEQHDAMAVTGVGRVTGAWGYPGLDDHLPLEAGRLLCVAGDPGGGKSSLVLQAALATARKLGPESVAIVPFEQPGQELTTILIAREIMADKRALENGWLGGEQRNAADAVRDELKRLRMFVRDTPENGTNKVAEVAGWLRSRRRRAAGKLHLVLVDHVALFTPAHPKETEYQRISEATGLLKALAMSGLCVLMVSQLNREGRKAGRNGAGLVELPPEPRIEDLRGSGSLEQDSDAVLFLWRRSDKRNPVRQVDLLCPKNRGGSDFVLHADFHAAAGQVFKPRRELPPPDDPDRRTAAQERAVKIDAAPSDAEDLFGVTR